MNHTGKKMSNCPSDAGENRKELDTDCFCLLFNSVSDAPLGPQRASLLLDAQRDVRSAVKLARQMQFPLCGRRPSLSWIAGSLEEDFGSLFDGKLSLVAEGRSRARIHADLRSGALLRDAILYCCNQEVVSTGEEVGVGPEHRRLLFDKPHVVSAIKQALPIKSESMVLDALRVAVVSRYSRNVDRFKTVSLLVSRRNVDGDGDEDNIDVFEVLSPFCDTVIESTEHSSLCRRAFEKAARIFVADCVFRRCNAQLLRRHAEEGLLRIVPAFFVDVFDAPPSERQIICQEYFGYLSPAAKSRLLRFGWKHGEHPFFSIGVLWQCLFLAIISDPVIACYLGPNLELVKMIVEYPLKTISR